jgi:hypothetical protein
MSCGLARPRHAGPYAVAPPGEASARGAPSARAARPRQPARWLTRRDSMRPGAAARPLRLHAALRGCSPAPGSTQPGPGRARGCSPALRGCSPALRGCSPASVTCGCVDPLCPGLRGCSPAAAWIPCALACAAAQPWPAWIPCARRGRRGPCPCPWRLAQAATADGAVRVLKTLTAIP